MKRNQHSRLLCLLIAGMSLSPALAPAQPTAHYVPGVEGIKAASLPPPGVYLKDYNAFYFADRRNDNNGDKIGGLDPKAFIYANVPRLIWITDYKLLGGFIGVDALLPVQYTDLELNTPGGKFKDNAFGIGDAFGEVTWSWHAKPVDVALGYGVWGPSGNSSLSRPAMPGLGYWTHMFTAGATWYPDEQKQWSVSALNRYEINTEKDDTDITPGQAWTVEGGISRALSKTVDVGVVGYYQMQVTKDSGDFSSDYRDKVAAVGPEVSVAYPRYMLFWSLRYLYEFVAEDRLQGHTVALTITKRF